MPSAWLLHCFRECCLCHQRGCCTAFECCLQCGCCTAFESVVVALSVLLGGAGLFRSNSAAGSGSHRGFSDTYCNQYHQLTAHLVRLGQVPATTLCLKYSSTATLCLAHSLAVTLCHTVSQVLIHCHTVSHIVQSQQHTICNSVTHAKLTSVLFTV